MWTKFSDVLDAWEDIDADKVNCHHYLCMYMYT